MIDKNDIISVKKYNWVTHWNYQVTTSKGVSGVPNDTENSDYQTIQKWIADGNSVEEAD